MGHLRGHHQAAGQLSARATPLTRSPRPGSASNPASERATAWPQLSQPEHAHRGALQPLPDLRYHPLHDPSEDPGVDLGADSSSQLIQRGKCQAGISVNPLAVGKRRCRSCWTFRLLNTFFGQSLPSRNRDRARPGGCLGIVRFTTRRARPVGSAQIAAAYAQARRTWWRRDGARWPADGRAARCCGLVPAGGRVSPPRCRR